MLDHLLKLLDFLISLARERRKDASDYFERYAVPTYELSRKVFEDYMKMLYDLRQLINDDAPRSELIQTLEQARLQYLPIRMQLRAIIWHTGETVGAGLFEKGVFGLLHGGLVHLEETAVANFGGDYFRGHTLLDILYELKRPNDEAPKRDLREIIRRQEEALEAAFRDASIGFEKLRRLTLPSTSVSKPKKAKKTRSA